MELVNNDSRLLLVVTSHRNITLISKTQLHLNIDRYKVTFSNNRFVAKFHELYNNFIYGSLL